MRLITLLLPPTANPQPGQWPVVVTWNETKIIRCAIDTVRQAIDDVEFRTRLGTDATTADTLMATLTSRRAHEIAAERPPRAASADELLVSVTNDDLLLITNALNEVLSGLPSTSRTPLCHFPDEEIESLWTDANAILDEAISRAPGRGM